MASKPLENKSNTTFGVLSPMRFLFVIVVGVGLAVLFSYLPWRQDLVNRFSRPFEYSFRHAVGKDPQLDPRIKIYALGDSTLEYLGEPDLSLIEWHKIFDALAKANPKAVFIDKLFGTPKGIDDANEFIQAVKGYDFPIITGAFVNVVEVNGRKSLKLDGEQYEVAKVFGDAYRQEADRFGDIKGLPQKRQFVYGPNPLVQDAFKSLGHIVYGGDNYIRPFFRIDEDHVLPSAPLLVASERRFVDGRLLVNGFEVFLDEDNRILANVAPRATYAEHTIALKSVVSRARKGEAIDTLPKDAVVIILPGMFTGNTDMVQTPYGTMPGGYVMTAMINSVLTGQWVKHSSWNVILPALAAFAGVILAINLGALSFTICMLLSIGAIVLAGLVSFAYFSYIVPWLFSACGLVIGGGVAFADKFRMTELFQQNLQKDIDLGSWAQKLFLPDRWEEQIEDTRYKVVFEPFGPMSGDWVQIHSSPQTVVLAMGDVVGKGPSAALNTAVIASVWTRHKEEWETNEPNIDHFVADLNATIYRLFRGKQFTTLSVAILTKDRVKLFCFGAPTWLLVTKTGEIESISLPARNPIGISPKDPQIRYKDLTLGKDQVLIGYSDGVIDGPAARRRLRDLLQNGNDITFSSIESKMRSAGAVDREPDDFTLLMIAHHDIKLEKSA